MVVGIKIKDMAGIRGIYTSYAFFYAKYCLILGKINLNQKV